MPRRRKPRRRKPRRVKPKRRRRKKPKRGAPPPGYEVEQEFSRAGIAFAGGDHVFPM